MRAEDYAANRKGPQAGAQPAAGGMFGTSQTPQATQASGTFTGFAQKPATGFAGGIAGDFEYIQKLCQYLKSMI